MVADVTVIEGAIPKEAQDRIESLLLGRQFPWYFQDEANYSNGPIKDKMLQESGAKDTFQLAHMFAENGIAMSPLFENLLPVVKAIPVPGKLLKVKANLTTYSPDIPEDGYCLPHVDQMFENGMTAVYYVNDSTGDTVIFNEEWTVPDEVPSFKNLTVKQRITPKKGTLVVFKNILLHSGNCPRTNDPRVVLNINFLADSLT